MKYSERKFEALIDAVFGSGESFVLEHQCFNGICFFLTSVFFLAAGVNFLLDLNIEMTLGTLVFGLFFIVVYYFSRYRYLFYPLYWIVLALGALFVNLAWFYSDGISGSAIIISLSILAIVNLILSGWRRLLSIFLICLNLGGMFLIEYFHPDLIVPYDSRTVRFVDIYLTFAIVSLIISFVIHFTMRHFRLERRKVKDREEKLKAIVDNIPDGVWLKDNQDRFTMVNKPFSQNCGFPVSQILGSTVYDIWPRDKAQQFQADDDHILISGKTLQREETLIDPETGERRFEIVKTPIMDESGRQTGIVGIARDITARYEYEDRLKKYECIVDTSIDQMALINSDYKYEAANESYLKAHGLKEKDLVGRTVSQIHAPDVFETQIRPHLDKAFSGAVVSYQGEVNYKDVGWRHEDVSYFPYKNKKGQTISVVAHIKDVTEKERMGQRLIQSEKMEAIGTLAGGIAHDFNNILSGILGYAQLGKININEPGKLNRHLDQIIKGSKRAGELIRQILTFSRQYGYEKQPIQTAIVVKEALKLIRATIPAFIEIDAEIDSKSYILSDPLQMHQIVMNLCTNAYQSMSQARGQLTIRLKDVFITDKDIHFFPGVLPGRYQNLEVTDTGEGIDDHTLEKIFDPYFTTKELNKGTGLGLALVHGIVEELKGFVKVKS
ncbi:MAG: PAS domain-containing protein [Desulfobacula sp.]|nr:PAS domain-containing protein [Desulfobacula sp.]